MFGHTKEECRKIVSQRQEWRAKASQVTSQSQHQQAEVHEQNGEEDFQPVTRHTVRHQVISNEDKLIHGEVFHLSTTKKFFITFVYGRNLEEQRLPLWENTKTISQSLEGDRIGGVEVNDGETKDFAECIQHCNLQEFNYEGPFFTWTNKTIWSKIDRALHNELWYEAFAYTHVQLKAQGLSDHTPVILSFPHLPKPKNTFLFCDMWTKDQEFKDIVKDIYAQQAKVRADLTQIQSLLHNDPLNTELNQQESQVRDKYISINYSAISLMQRQSKAEWIGLGNECTRMFMARIKQRKAMTCIFHIRDTNGQRVEGFKAVSDVMTSFYQDLLGRIEYHRTCVDPLMPRKMRNMMYVGINAVLYNIWLARNRRVFSSKVYPGQEVLKEIKRQITHRVLHLHQHRQKYTSCIDYLLHRI
ncbi:hypothetical protein Cgig2_008288 [Carnegiea gigantea]|uniref:Uncharacterized protein n=1 Tax=Carnegiea gigantea TaxID=171969 RepID=A0A9Q1QTC4_9CARY|nr:hypothetical protein Cgig2_008288 [Carnegiea gigantea]